MENARYFCIGGHNVSITFADGNNSMELLPSFPPFAINRPGGELLFSLTVDDTLRPSTERDLVRSFDTGNGDTLVYQLPDGGYEYIIRDIRGRDCCLLHAGARFRECRCALNGNEIMRSFGLNNALMLIYAFAGSYCDTLLIHASCVACNGWCYPFIAKSGTGKSTHSNLWLNYIEGTELVNDDNPIIRRFSDGRVMVYGSPWSGKTPCYRNVSFPLGALTRIDRAPANSIERLRPALAFASLLPACSSMKWDSAIYNNLCDTLSCIIEVTPVYTLHCLPDEEAARLCHKTISR